MRNYEMALYGELKTCFKCGNKFPYTIEHFYSFPKGNNKLMSYCKSCCKKLAEKYHAKNPEVAKKSRTKYKAKKRAERIAYLTATGKRILYRDHVNKFGQGFCIKGHQLIGDNLIASGNSKGRCKICRKEHKYKNRRRKSAARQIKTKTHCLHGHELTEDNLRKGTHARSCLMCHRLREAKHFKKEARKYIEIILKDPCVYCGKRSTEIDHIEPRIKGGSHEWDNLAPVCKVCNTRKHKRGMLVFMLDRLNNPLSGPERKKHKKAAYGF